MTSPLTRQRRLAPLLLGALVLATTFTACDSNSPTIDTSALIGVYQFTQFTFNPDASPSILTPANVLDTLVVTQTLLRFSSNGRFLLEYRYRGAPDDLLFMEGTYDVSDDKVEMVISKTFEGERKALLLPRDLSLRAQGGGQQLEVDLQRDNLTLSAFSPRYAGIGPVDGTLILRLNKR